MDSDQRDKFYRSTGYMDEESYLQSLRDAGKSTFTINDADNILWETGFATYCMENYEFEPYPQGIMIQL